MLCLLDCLVLHLPSPFILSETLAHETVLLPKRVFLPQLNLLGNTLTDTEVRLLDDF